MKVDLTYTYQSDDVRAIIVQQHAERYGAPPEGYQWKAEEIKYSDGEYRVTAVEMPRVPVTLVCDAEPQPQEDRVADTKESPL